MKVRLPLPLNSARRLSPACGTSVEYDREEVASMKVRLSAPSALLNSKRVP